MQFPKGKKERIQMAVAILLVVGGGLYVLMTFVVSPFRASYAANLAEIASLTKQLDDAKEEISKGKNAKTDCEDMRAKLREIDRTCILREEHGNYNIFAQEYVNSVFSVPNVEMDGPVPEGQFYVIPKARGGNKLKSFVVPISCTISGNRSYEHLLDLFRKIETGNKYMSISKVNIGVVLPATTNQSVSFTISWPIWEDPTIATNFLSRMDQADGETNSVRAATKGKDRRK